MKDKIFVWRYKQVVSLSLQPSVILCRTTAASTHPLLIHSLIHSLTHWPTQDLKKCEFSASFVSLIIIIICYLDHRCPTTTTTTTTITTTTTHCLFQHNVTLPFLVRPSMPHLYPVVSTTLEEKKYFSLFHLHAKATGILKQAGYSFQLEINLVGDSLGS